MLNCVCSCVDDLGLARKLLQIDFSLIPETLSGQPPKSAIRTRKSAGEHKGARESTGEHRRAQESTREHGRAHESTGEHRTAQESTGEQRRAPKER
jgi:hypothetical protein